LDAYADATAICFITVVTEGRAPLLARTALARSLTTLLTRVSRETATPLYAFCFMPDHLHLLVGPPEGGSILEFMQRFKGMSTRLAWKHGHSGRLWQPRFYDHFLRAEEDVKETAHYILANPVRRGLAAEWNTYPFSGSLVFDL
jgi:putative transposase